MKIKRKIIERIEIEAPYSDRVEVNDYINVQSKGKHIILRSGPKKISMMKVDLNIYHIIAEWEKNYEN